MIPELNKVFNLGRIAVCWPDQSSKHALVIHTCAFSHTLQTYVKDHHYFKPTICRLTRKQAGHYLRTTKWAVDVGRERGRETERPERESRRQRERERRNEPGQMRKIRGGGEGKTARQGREIKADMERKGSSCQTLSGVKHHHKYNLIRSESVRTHTDTRIHTLAQTWPVFKISVSAVSNSKQ